MVAAALTAATLAAGPSFAEPETRRATQTAADRVSPEAQPAAAPQLRRKGRWLVDRAGRVVIVHGFNLVWKLDPYVPPATKDGFTVRDAKWLRRYGFNGVRLGTLWAGLTPDAPGMADPNYRRKWQRVMDLLADRGIWMQLDMHQDQWHETYGGEGVPDWAVHRPTVLDVLPPLNLPFPIGYWTPENSMVFDEFWADKHNGIGDWASAWQVAARWWKNQPYLMGYDLMNEPWMGLEWPSCISAGCESSYRDELQPAYERVTKAIREVDANNIVWWEPQQLSAGQLIPMFLEPLKGESQLGLSWHNYCQDVFLESQGLPFGDVENCWKFSRDRQTTVLDQAERIRAASMMSEWGATDNLRAIEIDAAVADEHLMGWSHWSYKRWQDPTTADDAQGMFTDDTDFSSVKKDKLKVLVRTYARAVAGTPTKMSFDAQSGDFVFTYRPDRSIRKPTEIFVSPLHYPKGYRIQVKHGDAVRRAHGILAVRATSNRPVTVRITGR